MMKNKLIILLISVMLISCACDIQPEQTTPTATPTQEVTPTQELTPIPTQLPEEERIVTISGSTMIEKYGNASLEDFMEQNAGYTVTYQGVGSTDGVENANEGVTQIGAVSRELTGEEKAYGMSELLIGYDVIYIITHIDNPVDSLTLDELKGIYLGEIKNWKDVGGDDAEILVYSREDGSGTRWAFEDILDIEDMVDAQGNENINIFEGSGTIIAPIMLNPYSIGYISSYTYLGHRKYTGMDEFIVMEIEGYKPDYENIWSENYALLHPFYYVYHQENLNTAAQEYLDFVVSREGQLIAVDRGLIPIEGVLDEK